MKHGTQKAHALESTSFGRSGDWGFKTGGSDYKDGSFWFKHTSTF